MKKKLSSKKCIALILAVVMIVTSVPLMMAGAIGGGAYDPAPYWGDGSNDAASNTSFIATLNVDGSIKVSFPHATPAATWDTYTAASPSKKRITNYIFEITRMDDDGTHEPIWTENIDVSQSTTPAGGTFTVDNTEGNNLPNSIYYWPGAFTGLEGYKIESSYDISIQAVDSDGWVSDKIHTLLSETPYYIINDDFSPNESWIVREMLLFEGKGSAEVNAKGQSNGGADGVTYEELVAGTGATKIDFVCNMKDIVVHANGQLAGMGYDKSPAYRFWISDTYKGTPYTFETTWSRSHYDFTGAEEVWFYVDMTRVEINKVAFTLSANEKYAGHFRDNKGDTTDTTMYGDTFSTASVNGVNEGTISKGIYIQNSDGLWETTSMTDGYFTELAGYKGFIRIPVDYFIIQKDQYMTGQLKPNETWLGTDCDTNLPAANDENLNAYVERESIHENDKLIYNGKTYNAVSCAESASGMGILINPAGTSVTEAVVLYERWETYGNWGTKTINKQLRYVAGDVSQVTNDDGSITYTVNSPIHSISDLISAGIQVADWTAESVHKSFYIDQVMFCQKNTGGVFDSNGYVTEDSPVKFNQEGSTVNANGTADLGRKMAGFYNRTVEVPKAVAQYIMQYFGEIPSLNDAAAKSMIDDIILEYCECFGIAKNSPLLDETRISQALEKINSLGYTEAYNRYKDAERFVDFVYSENAESNFNAVIYFENMVEKLPNPEFIDHTDKELQSTLKQLMAIYETFNLSHHELLGADAKEKFLELYNFIVGEEVKTGQSIGAYPFIPFNDFETNYSYGQLSDMYYDDYPAYSDSKPTDINSTGNFTTYVSGETISQAGYNADARTAGAIGWSPADYRPTGETVDSSLGTYFSRMDAQITNKGFADSLGATIRINGSLDSSSNLVMATLSTTYLGAEADTWANLPGLDLSALALKTDTTNGTDAEDVTRYGTGIIPNSFVMYVDFTNVTSINMNIKFILSDPDGNDVNCFFCAGDISQTPAIYQLDENGEWEAQNLQASQIDTKGANYSDEGAIALCTIAPSSLNKLEGYKGFIRIPLSNFRTPKKEDILFGAIKDATTGAYNLDNILDDGYKIKQAKITFWDYTGANVGKNITIDGLGFTYDPKCQTRVSNNTNCNGELNQDNGIYITNMDEYFGVKTVDSNNFEKMVSTIDPYASEAEFKASFEACNNAFLALSDYQKGIPEVKYCKEEILEKKYRALYTDYTNEIKKEQWQPYYKATADATAIQQLKTDLAGISAVAKSYSVNSESIYDLYEDHKENYLEQLGFASIEEAAQVVTIYEKGLHRLSVAERNAFMYKDGATFESGYTDEYNALYNAYNAANRAILIGGDAGVHEGVAKDGIIADVETFKSSIINIYGLSSHSDEDADRIIDTEDDNNGDGVVDAKDFLRTVSYKAETTDESGNAVKALKYYTDMYADISVFGKMFLSNDTDTAAAYMNMYDAAEAIYDNSTAIVPNAGETVLGGIVTYEKRIKDAYSDVSSKIEAKTVLDTPTLNEIEYCLGQYEAFLRRYALVDELNYAYADLALLLPTASLETSDVVTLTNSKDSPLYLDVANAELTYVAARLGRNVSVYLVTDYKWTQKGETTYDFGYFTVNGATCTDGTTVYTQLGEYANGTTVTFAPEISVDETKAKKVPLGNVYEGTVKLLAFDSAMITDGVDVSTLEPVSTIEIPIEFTSVSGPMPAVYTVTIPAKVDIDWKTNGPVDVSYSVKATLGSNVLSVSVSSVSNDGTDKLINNDTGVAYELAYSKANFGTETFTGDVADGTKPTNAPSITVTGWENVPVGAYSTQLTYTVDITS